MATEELRWVVDMRNRIEGMDPSAETEQYWSKHSIYRVPFHVKDLNPKAYTPQAVSLGPFHHGEPHLLPMEEHKRRALRHFLRRADVPLYRVAAAVSEVAQSLQDAYHELDGEFRDMGRFVELMIVDGCFMLEVIRETAGRSGDYASNDPIFGSHGVVYIGLYIRRDMLMIENQLPLLLLKTLLAVETGREPPDEDLINGMILAFLWLPLEAGLGLGLGLHPLDVLRKSILQSPPRNLPDRTDSEPAWIETIRPAMELHEAGLRFKKSETGSLRDIQFSRGVLSLPHIVVDDTTEYIFLNLLAFESLHVGAGTEVTCYIFLMNGIINSANDVKLLNSEGIVQHFIASDEAMVELFNRLSKDWLLPHNSLLDVHRMVSSYCRKPWRRWRATLVRTYAYLRSPWAAIPLVAAIFLLFLSIMQTVYTVLQYYQKNNSSSPLLPPPPPSFAPLPQ